MTLHAPIETKSAARPENKAAGGAVDAALDEFGRAFEAFKETNDTRLAQIETRLSADVLTEEKLTRIDAALEAEALTLAHRLAAGPTVALRMIRRGVAEALESTLDEALEREAQDQRQARGTADSLEGGMAFLAKRKPDFRGR